MRSFWINMQETWNWKYTMKTVQLLQIELKKFQPTLVVDGKYGKKTRLALDLYPSVIKLVDDQARKESLPTVLETCPCIYNTYSGQTLSVAILQSWLSTVAPCRIDGKLGPKTKALARHHEALVNRANENCALMRTPLLSKALFYVENSSQQVWLKEVVPAIVKNAPKLGLRPIPLIAQMGLETSWGKHVPILEGKCSYNYAGIKLATATKFGITKGAQCVTQECINGRVQKVKDSFAIFTSGVEFAQVYLQYLGTSARYVSAKYVNSDEAFVNALSKGGYATDPKYVDKVMRCMPRASRIAQSLM